MGNLKLWFGEEKILRPVKVADRYDIVTVDAKVVPGGNTIYIISVTAPATAVD